MVTLLCTVRGCRHPLALEGRRAFCERGHSYDLARSGYLNLLQPQDSRSRAPGDSAAAVGARRRFLDRGFADALTAATVALLPPAAAMLDVGCGEGTFLEGARDAMNCEAHGVDLSVEAIDAAARRHRDCRFVVANADRFLPYANGSFELITSINARLVPEEFHRVAGGEGQVVVAVAAPDDLIELRAAILGEGTERDRTARTIETFAPHFHIERQERIAARVRLDRAAIEDVTTSSYRALRHRERERLRSIDSIEVTMSRDVLVFARRS